MSKKNYMKKNKKQPLVLQTIMHIPTTTHPTTPFYLPCDKTRRRLSIYIQLHTHMIEKIHARTP